MDPSARTYDVFLSYNSRDHQAVERVGRWLKDHGLTCFMDRWYLVPGTSWPSALEQALKQSKAVAVFLGPGEMGRWQQREHHLALDRQAVVRHSRRPRPAAGLRPAAGVPLAQHLGRPAGPARRRAAAERAGRGRPRPRPGRARAREPGRRSRPSARSAACSPTARRTPPSSSADRTTRTSSSRPSRVIRSWPSWGPPAAASRPWCGPAWCRGCGPTRRRSGTSSPWCRRPDP